VILGSAGTSLLGLDGSDESGDSRDLCMHDELGDKSARTETGDEM
jgi:hypothetical protein